MTKTGIFITSTVLITLSLPLAQAAIRVPGSITVADLAKETLARKTLKQIQVSAAAVAAEAGQLRMLANSESSPDSHLAKLTALKGEINRMGQEINGLDAERELLAPWEQRAVDDVFPLLQADAANTESAIAYFNANRGRLWTEAYRDYAGHVWQDSEQIARILKDYRRYDKLRDQEVRVEQRIWADSQRNAE